MASFVRIVVLIWTDLLAVYAMWVMMTYLTNVWKLDFTHAAAIINIWGGLSSVLPVGFAFLVDTIVGDYLMLLLSSLAYCIGLGFLWMSTPPVLSNATGTCGGYRPECIGDTQRILFYTALGLISVGISGHMVSLGRFLNRQVTRETEDAETDQGSKMAWQFAGTFAVILFAIIGAFVLPYIKPWSVRFGIPAIFTLVATIIFLTGSCSYKHEKPQGSPLTTVFRVIVASASKMLQPSPDDVNKLYEKHNDPEVMLLPHTNCLRCLDKAAIVLRTQTLEEQEHHKWKLSSVKEVEGTKLSIRMIPVWLTFIICGVVSSIGNTYFLEQANHMNRKVGKLKVPLPIFLMFYEFAKAQLSQLYFKMAKCLGESGSKRYAPSIGIVVAMLFSVLCCITAAKVETRRLGAIKSHGLVDKPDERIPMSIFWLLPQFLLLGAVDGLAEISIDGFFKDQAPPPMRCYSFFFTNGVLGLGIAGSVLSVYIAGKVSERGGKPSWFQGSLSKSRLDKYYWMLAAVSAVNLVLFMLVAICYRYREPEEGEEEEPEDNELADPFDDDVQCSCCCR